MEKRSNDPCIVQRFINEVMVHAKLEHDNIVRVYDAGNVSGLRYLVMKYVDGSTLAEFIGKGQGMRLPAARRCLEEILTGLAYAHGKSVIHRDIKPSNIFVTEAGKCKIGDFGGAFEQESSGSGYTCIGLLDTSLPRFPMEVVLQTLEATSIPLAEWRMRCDRANAEGRVKAGIRPEPEGVRRVESGLTSARSRILMNASSRHARP
jgi:serine/threonine-protein kinase